MAFNTILAVLTDTAYTFIPVLVCWSACSIFGGAPAIGLVLGLMLVSPSLPDKWSVVFGNAEALKLALGPIVINIQGYQSSVLPALFLGFFAAVLEKKLHQVIPDIVDLLLVPTVCLAHCRDGELQDRHVLIALDPSLSSRGFVLL